MANLIFCAMLFGVLLGIISGRVYMHFVPDLSEQIMPTWLFAGIMSAVITFLVSIVLAFVFKSSIQTHFMKLAAIAAISSELLLVLMMYKSVQKK